MNYSNANVYIKDAAFGSAFVDIDPSGANNTIRYFSDEDFSIVYHDSSESLSGAYNENLRDFVYPSLSMDIAEGDFNVHAANYTSIFFSGLRLFNDVDGYSNSGCSGFYDFHDMNDGYLSGIYQNQQLLIWRHRSGNFFLSYGLSNLGDDLLEQATCVDASGQGLDTGVHWDSVSGYNDTNGMAFFFLNSGYNVLQESHELGYDRTPIYMQQHYVSGDGDLIIDSRYNYYFQTPTKVVPIASSYKLFDMVELNLTNSSFDTFDNRQNPDSVINFSPAYNSPFSKTNGYPFLMCIKSHTTTGISLEESLADPRVNYGFDANIREYWKLCFRLPMKYSEDLFVPFVFDSPEKRKTFIYGMDEFNDPNFYRHYIPDLKSYHYYNSGTGGNSKFFIIGAQSTNSLIAPLTRDVPIASSEIVSYDWRPYEFPSSSGLNGTLITGLIDYGRVVDPLGGSLINHYYINYQSLGSTALNYFQQPPSPRKLTSTNDVLDNRQWGYSFTQIMSGADVTWSGSKTQASLISGSTGRLAIADTKYAEISILNAVTGSSKRKIYSNWYYHAAFVDINSTGKYGSFRHGGTGKPVNAPIPGEAYVGLDLYQAKDYTRDTFNWGGGTSKPYAENYQANYAVVSRDLQNIYRKVFYYERNDGLLLTTISNGGSLGYRTGDSYILELSKTNVTDPDGLFWKNINSDRWAYTDAPIINKSDIGIGDYNYMDTWVYLQESPRSIVKGSGMDVVIKDKNYYRATMDIENIYSNEYSPRLGSIYWEIIGTDTSLIRKYQGSYQKNYWKYVKRLPTKASEMPVMLGITGTGDGSFLRDPSIYHFQVYSGHYYYSGQDIFEATKDLCWVSNTPTKNFITGFANNYYPYEAGLLSYWGGTNSGPAASGLSFSYDLSYDTRAVRYDMPGNLGANISVQFSGRVLNVNKIYALNFWCKLNGNYNDNGSQIKASLFNGTDFTDYRNQLVANEWRHVILTGSPSSNASFDTVFLLAGNNNISLSFAEVRFGESTYGAGSEFDIRPISIEDLFTVRNVISENTGKLGRFLKSDFGNLEKQFILYQTGNLSGIDSNEAANKNYFRYFAHTRDFQYWSTGGAAYDSFEIGNEKVYPDRPLTNQSTIPIISGVKTTANDIINKFTLLNEQYGSKSFFTYGPEESYKNYLYPEYISENIKYFMSVSGIGNTNGAISAISSGLIDSTFNFLPASNVSISNQTQSTPRRMLGNRSEEEDQYAYFGPLNQAINLDCYLSAYHQESFDLLMSATGDNLYHLKVGKNVYKNCYLNSLALNIEPFKPVKASASFNSISSPLKRVKGLRKNDPEDLVADYGMNLVYGQNCLISPSANQFVGSSKSLINYSVVCSRSVSNSIGTFEPQRVFLESVEKELVISSNDFTYFIDFSGQKIEEEIIIRMFTPYYGYLSSFQMNPGSMLVAQRYSVQAGDVAKIDISFKELVL